MYAVWTVTNEHALDCDRMKLHGCKHLAKYMFVSCRMMDLVQKKVNFYKQNCEQLVHPEDRSEESQGPYRMDREQGCRQNILYSDLMQLPPTTHLSFKTVLNPQNVAPCTLQKGAH